MAGAAGDVAFVACLLQALRLFVIRAQLRRTGRPPRGGWASLALVGVAIAIFLSPYRPFSDTEQRTCKRAVTVAIVAERDGEDDSTAPTLALLAREQDIRYAIRHHIEQAGAAVRAQQAGASPTGADESVAEAGRRLQRSCGYRRPPF